MPSRRSPSTATSSTATIISESLQQKGAGCEQGTGSALANHRTIIVFLEAEGEHLLAAARAGIDEQGYRPPPTEVHDALFAIAIFERHDRTARIENIEIARLRAAPAVAQIPDHRIGMFELARGQLLLECFLILAAGIRPDADVTDALAMRFDNAGAVPLGREKRLVGLDKLRRYRHRERRPLGIAPHHKRDRLADLVAKWLHRLEGFAVDRDDLVADQQSRLGAGLALESPADEDLSADLPRKNADFRIDDAPTREQPRQIAPQPMLKNIHQLVVGRLLLGVEAGVRGTEPVEHAIDDGGTVGPDGARR